MNVLLLDNAYALTAIIEFLALGYFTNKMANIRCCHHYSEKVRSQRAAGIRVRVVLEMMNKSECKQGHTHNLLKIDTRY